jgi:Na+-translocating ferredoxin:NAD+ oxidoreductase RnfG subunit
MCGTDVMIFKIFSPKNLAKILAFFAQSAATFCKNLIIKLFFEKNANFFDQNWQKSQKILIITSTPGLGLKIVESTINWMVLKYNSSVIALTGRFYPYAKNVENDNYG